MRQTDLVANRIYMPLTDDGMNVHYILGAMNFAFGDAVHSGAGGSGRLEPAGQYIEPIEITVPVAA